MSGGVRKMDQDYDWLFIRNNLQQTSPGDQEPSNASPDIIIRSAQASKGDLQDFVAEYDKDCSQAVDYQGKNYIYIRAKNLNQEEGNIAVGTASLWYCLGNINDQTRWTQLTTQAGKNAVTIYAEGQKVAVTQTPFILENVAPPAQEPYNLIAVITDVDHPEPWDLVNDDLKDAIVQSGNAAYLTLPLPTPPPVKETGFGWSSNVNLNNADQIHATVRISATQFDEGAEMYFIFDKPDAEGNVISIGRSKLGPNRVYGTEAVLPKNYASQVSVYYFTNSTDSGQLGANFNLQIVENAESGSVINPTTLLEGFSVSITQVAKVLK
jgi:hypothetical protein